MRSILNVSWQRRLTAGAALVVIAAMSFFVAAARPDAGNPILGTIKATKIAETATTVTVSVRGEWNWLSHNSDCNYDRAATGAGIMWGDRNGADYSRTITSAVRSNNVVTLTIPTHTFSVGDHINVSGLTGAGAAMNGGPFTITAESNTTVKYSQTGANIAAGSYGGAGKLADLDVFNGWLVYKSAASNGYIGTKISTAQSAIDREVHPTDVGNVPADGQGPLPGAPGQVIFDPGPNGTTGLGDYTKWKGGCGREPVVQSAIPITSATEGGATGKVVTLTLGAPGNASFAVGDSITVAGVANASYNGSYNVTGTIGSNQITYTSGKTGLPASSGGTVTDNTSSGTNQSGPGCLEWCGDPWGSWGYQAVNGYPAAYTHTYLKTLPDGSSGLPDKICVNFYDVHGGGTTASTFQVVNGAKEIQVDANGDNSISTNAFNVNEGSNCTSIIVNATPTITTDAGSGFALGSLPGTLSDTATLTNGANLTGAGKITFSLYGPNNATCSGSPIFTSEVTNITANGSYPSAAYTPTQAGTYRWIANFSGDANNAATSNTCNGANENVVVDRADSNIVTHQSLIPQDNVTVTGSAVTPTGNVTFELYKTACSGSPVFSQTKTLSGNPAKAKTTNSGVGPNGYTANGNGTWYWKVAYAGDGSNQPSASNCTETFTISEP